MTFFIDARGSVRQGNSFIGVYTPLRSGFVTNESSKQGGGSGNFQNDREKAAEAGRKGGQHSHQGTPNQESGDRAKHGGHGGSEGSGGQRGGSGNFANDPDKAGEAGRKGGEHSHGGK
jgi:hypothetical protein